MSRSLYLFGFAFLLLTFLAISPIACTNPNPTGPLATYSATPGVVVITLAGSGSAGSSNGVATAASFKLPIAAAVDSSGDIYVADYGNNLIREISPSLVVTTLAGGGTSFNGTGTAAQFDGPTGIAVDSSGNVYVADWDNQLIRKITGGVVSTFAGQQGVTGATNATGTAASFNYPNSVAVDSSGNIYIADEYNQLIREITPGGVVSTLAGQAGVTGATNATGTAATFNYPQGIAVDSSGNVYVGDTNNFLIRKITPGRFRDGNGR